MVLKVTKAGVGAVLALGLVAATNGPALAQDFYAGKTITLLVGTDETGGFTIYSRLIGNYLGKYIPGAPKVVVSNMPGAGGTTAAIYLYGQAPRDGTTIASLTPDSVLEPLFGRKNIDPTKFGYIAGAERSTRLCVSSERSPVKTLAQAMDHQIIIGATQPGSPTADYANLIRRGTHAKFKIVMGYKGIGSLYLAMQRGEIQGACGVDWSALKAQQGQLLREKKINVLTQVSVHPNAELDAMRVPQPWSFMKSEKDRQAAQLMVDFQQAFGKGFVTPPNVPRERLEILRTAFAKTLQDKQFLADAHKMHLDVDPIPGEEVGKTVQNLYAASPQTLRRLKDLTEDKKAM